MKIKKDLSETSVKCRQGIRKDLKKYT